MGHINEKLGAYRQYCYKGSNQEKFKITINKLIRKFVTWPFSIHRNKKIQDNNFEKQPPADFYKKSCFAAFTGKHLCWSLLLIKLQTWSPWGLHHRCFLRNIAKFSRPPISKNISKRLILIFLSFPVFSSPCFLYFNIFQ